MANKKNKHLISEKLYDLLLTCKENNRTMLFYKIKQCKKELENLKPKPLELKIKKEIIPTKISITKVSSKEFLKLLQGIQKCTEIGK